MAHWDRVHVSTGTEEPAGGRGGALPLACPLCLGSEKRTMYVHTHSHCRGGVGAWGQVNHRPPLILPSRVARDIAVHGASSTLHSAPGCRPFSPAVQAAALAPPSDRRGRPDSPAWSRRRSLGVDHKPVAARPLREALLQRRVQGDGWRAAGERGARLRQVARM